jgi:hypothetical protein
MKEVNIYNIDSKLLYLYQRYFFSRDIGDFIRAEYWLSRIKEYQKQSLTDEG